MKRNLLGVLKANTSPVSNDEFDKFLVRRHGTLAKGNASADPSALDSVGRDALESKKKPSARYRLIQETRAKRNVGVLMKMRRPGLGRKVAEGKIASPISTKKKVYGF